MSWFSKAARELPIPHLASRCANVGVLGRETLKRDNLHVASIPYHRRKGVATSYVRVPAHHSEVPCQLEREPLCGKSGPGSCRDATRISHSRPAFSYRCLSQDTYRCLSQDTQQGVGFIPSRKASLETETLGVAPGQLFEIDRNDGEEDTGKVADTEHFPEGDCEESKGMKRSEASEKLRRFLGKASVLTTLLESRLALPIMYPLSERGMYGSMNAPPIASAQWNKELLSQSLGHTTPSIVATTKIVKLLKGLHALSHYGAGRKKDTRNTHDANVDHQFTLRTIPKKTKDTGTVRRILKGKTKTHFLRPQHWRMLQPGNELRTKHLHWR